jgi:hypothetical protein
VDVLTNVRRAHGRAWVAGLLGRGTWALVKTAAPVHMHASKSSKIQLLACKCATIAARLQHVRALHVATPAAAACAASMLYGIERAALGPWMATVRVSRDRSRVATRAGRWCQGW